MAAKKSGKKPALNEISPRRPQKPTTLSRVLEGIADLEFEIPEAPPRRISFELEEIQTWPPRMHQALLDLFKDSVYWAKAEKKREKWRLKNHKRKLATQKAAA